MSFDKQAVFGPETNIPFLRFGLRQKRAETLLTLSRNSILMKTALVFQPGFPMLNAEDDIVTPLWTSAVYIFGNILPWCKKES